MSERKYTPYVPETVSMTEFTARAVIIGIVLTLILGAANAYLGLRAGVTIAATYPAAVISMALLRVYRRARSWKRTSRALPARSANRWRPARSSPFPRS